MASSTATSKQPVTDVSGPRGDPAPASDGNRAVFLSYASQDAEAAARICSTLRNTGIEVWFDQNELRGGVAWDAAIRKQIKSCALFIPIISRNSRARVEGYFRLEWKFAVDRSYLMAAEKAFLLPVVIDDTSEGDARVPEKFHEVQWTRLSGGETPPAFVEQLLRLLTRDEYVAPAGAASAVTELHNSTVFAPAEFARSPRRSAAPAIQFPLHRPKTISEKSIAVLPFMDMSQDKDQEYFSDGLTEELIGLLVKVPELRVPARTSCFYLRASRRRLPISRMR